MPSRTRNAAPDTEPKPEAAAAQDSAIRVLKKYPNRRLYDTRTSSYITLADVKQMVLAGEGFEVRDAKTGEEITRSILLQIILEEESAGVPMFSTQTLAQIIRFYGHAMQGLMGTLLERNMAAFAEMQQQFLQQGKQLMPGFDPGKTLSPEAWTQFMSGQPQAMQHLMNSYLETSRSLFEKMPMPGNAWFPGSTKK
jgi:polyhydroxyalkanoate synthesis repressor PhaR